VQKDEENVLLRANDSLDVNNQCEMLDAQLCNADLKDGFYKEKSNWSIICP
jgi:hypothetical protein